MTDKDNCIAYLEKRIKQLEYEKALQENNDSFAVWKLHFATDNELFKAREELRLMKGYEE